MAYCPFGKSILKAKDPTQVDSTRVPFVDDEVSAQCFKDGEGDDKGGNGSGKSMAVNAIYEAEGGNEGHRQYPRFIVPFMDQAEAHRFVQNWHRRELKLRIGGRGKDQPSWEESRIINATVLW
ncbi:hypothetical protein CHU98_g12490 [Xylaria longipes]|nr:hypothetical protein CHU98_g12490 [Xylaria longipes]